MTDKTVSVEQCPHCGGPAWVRHEGAVMPRIGIPCPCHEDDDAKAAEAVAAEIKVGGVDRDIVSAAVKRLAIAPYSVAGHEVLQLLRNALQADPGQSGEAK